MSLVSQKIPEPCPSDACPELAEWEPGRTTALPPANPNERTSPARGQSDPITRAPVLRRRLAHVPFSGRFATLTDETSSLSIHIVNDYHSQHDG